jgi:hypothetical protein
MDDDTTELLIQRSRALQARAAELRVEAWNAVAAARHTLRLAERRAERLQAISVWSAERARGLCISPRDERERPATPRLRPQQRHPPRSDASVEDRPGYQPRRADTPAAAGAAHPP